MVGSRALCILVCPDHHRLGGNKSGHGVPAPDASLTDYPRLGPCGLLVGIECGKIRHPMVEALNDMHIVDILRLSVLVYCYGLLLQLPRTSDLGEIFFWPLWAGIRVTGGFVRGAWIRTVGQGLWWVCWQFVRPFKELV